MMEETRGRRLDRPHLTLASLLHPSQSNQSSSLLPLSPWSFTATEEDAVEGSRGGNIDTFFNATEGDGGGGGSLDHLTVDNSNNNSSYARLPKYTFNSYFDNESLPIDMRFNDGHILQISCYSVILAISLVGNLCVLKAILGGGRKQRKSRVNTMLLHLAIADLIVSTTFSTVQFPPPFFFSFFVCVCGENVPILI